jgi:hypothetical protein
MKYMKNLLWLCTLAGLSCVPSTSPIRISGLYPLSVGTQGECKLDSKVGQIGGLLDPQGGGDFGLVVGIDSELTPAPIESSQQRSLIEAGRFNFNVEAFVLNYRSTNPVISFEQETVPVAFIVKPSSTDNRIGADIIGDKAAAKMKNQLNNPDQTTQLIVGIALKGKLSSGETVTSNTLDFPIDVRPMRNADGTVGCMGSGEVVRNGPCGLRGGQGGYTYVCCTGPGTPVGCP